MLLHDVPGKAVRMVVRLPLGVGQDVDLAVRLLERLRDAEVRKPLPPGQHLAASDCIGCQRRTRTSGAAEIEARSALVEHAIRLRQPRDPALAEPERPDQPARHAR